MTRIDDFEQATQGLFRRGQREKLLEKQCDALEAKLDEMRAAYEAKKALAIKRARRIEYAVYVVLTILACLLPLVLNWWEAGQ